MLADFLLGLGAVVRVVAFLLIFLDVFLAAPVLPAAFVTVLLVTLVFEVLFLEGFFVTFFLAAFFLAGFFLDTFFLTTFFFVVFFLLVAFFLLVFFFAFFFATFFRVTGFFFVDLRANFFFPTLFLATFFRAFEVVFFREGFFLAAICSSPDGNKITAALYIRGPDFKGVFRQPGAGSVWPRSGGLVEGTRPASVWGQIDGFSRFPAGGAKIGDDTRVDAAADVEPGGQSHVAGIGGAAHIVQQAIRHGFMECPDPAECPDVGFQRLELQAKAIRHILQQ